MRVFDLLPVFPSMLDFSSSYANTEWSNCISVLILHPQLDSEWAQDFLPGGQEV